VDAAFDGGGDEARVGEMGREDRRRGYREEAAIDGGDGAARGRGRRSSMTTTARLGLEK
jgi:hypothetical protein